MSEVTSFAAVRKTPASPTPSAVAKGGISKRTPSRARARPRLSCMTRFGVAAAAAASAADAMPDRPPLLPTLAQLGLPSSRSTAGGGGYSGSAYGGGANGGGAYAGGWGRDRRGGYAGGWGVRGSVGYEFEMAVPPPRPPPLPAHPLPETQAAQAPYAQATYAEAAYAEAGYAEQEYAEPRYAEPRYAEPRRPDVMRKEAVARYEAAQAEAVRAEAARAEAARYEAAQVEAARAEAARAEVATASAAAARPSMAFEYAYPTGGGAVRSNEPPAAPAARTLPPFDAAISAAATLPDRGPLTLRTGLAPGDGEPGLAEVGPVREYVAALRMAVQLPVLDARKMLAALDGGGGGTDYGAGGGVGGGGVVEGFRRARSAYLRKNNPRRESSSISGTSFVDGRYFARQLFLPMIEELVIQTAKVEEVVLAILPEAVAAKVIECADMMNAGGGKEVKRRLEAAAEAAGEACRRQAVLAKEAELREKNKGAELDVRQRKLVRDIGSSRKSNEKRKKLYSFTRNMLQELLLLREDVFNALYSVLLLGSMPSMDPRLEYASTPGA